MKTALKLFAMFAVTVLFLSIDIKGKTIFAHMYQFISPATKTAQNAVEDFFDSSVDTTQSYSKKIFDNSVPKVKDSVKAKMSGLKKGPGTPPQEEITIEEKEELDELIKSHRR